MPQSVSRTNVSLDTGEGPTQYYDQVCALSVQTINDNFELLFKQRPEVAKLTYNDGTHGILQATVLPPKIMIDPNEERNSNPKLYLKIAFENGSIWYSAQSNPSISGWVITVSANLENMVASAAHDDTDKTRLHKKRALGELQKTFALSEESGMILYDPTKIEPGKYSIHRLFAAITENAWNTPVEEHSTVRTKDGKTMLLSEWEKSSVETLSTVMRVKETLKFWALQHQHSSFFTLGLELRVTEAESSDPKPTFVPSSARLQGYPYISQESFDASRAKGKEPTGVIDDPHNCLVICETVSGRRLPSIYPMPFTSNLASPAPSAGGRHLPGTFVLDHRLFLQGHLLRRLQGLCVGAMVVPLYPRLYVAPDGAGRCEAVYVVGAAPTDPSVTKNLKVVPPAKADDDFYAFKPDGARRYKWSQRFEAPGSGTETYEYRDSPQYPLFRHWVTYSTQEVTVSWSEGDDKFFLSGSTLFHHWEAYSSRRDFPWKNMGPDMGYWGLYEITAKWTVEIDLTVPTAPDASTDGSRPINGVVDPKVVGVDESTGLPTNLKVKTSTQRYDIDKNFKVAEQKIKDSLSESMKHIIEDIKGKFNSTGRFTYPGASTLVFGRPQLSNNGDVFADIDFQPPKEGLVNVRAPSDPKLPFGNPFYRQPEIITIPANPTVDTRRHVHLAWQVTVDSYDPGTGRLEITLVATNPSTVNIAFQMVKVQMLPVRRVDTTLRLFTEHDSEWEEKKSQPVGGGEKTGENNADDNKGGENKTGESKTGDSKTPDDKADEKKAGEKETKTGKAGERDGKGKGSGEPTVTVNVKKGGEQGSKASATQTPAPEGELAQPGDKKATDGKKPKAQPVEEEFHPTWLLQPTDIKQALEVSVSREGSLDFTIVPRDELPSGLRARFVMEPDSTFTLGLEGTAPEPGEYVIQVHELWESTDLKDEFDSSQWADSFASVKLIRSGDGEGRGIFRIVSFEEAEKIQGVSKETETGTA